MTLFLPSPLSGCGFCRPSVPVTLELPPAPAIQGRVVIVSIPPTPSSQEARGGEHWLRVCNLVGWPGFNKKFAMWDTFPLSFSLGTPCSVSRGRRCGIQLQKEVLRFPVQALGGGPHTFFNSPPDNVKGAFVGSMGEVSGCRTNFSMTQPCSGWAQLGRCKKQPPCRASWSLVAELPSSFPGL